VTGRSRVRAFVEAVVVRSVAQILGFLRELSGESAYYRYVDGRHRRRGFPEESIMTQPEYERWQTEAQEQQSRDTMLGASQLSAFERLFTLCIWIKLDSIC
jgi:hypothetical protein